MRRHIEALVLIGVISGALYFGYYWIIGRQELNSADHVQEHLLPKLTGKFESLNGQSLDLSQISEPVVLLHFWASWCSPCITEVPALVRFASQFQGKVRIVAISGDRSTEDVKSFLKSFKELNQSNISIVLDLESKIRNRFSVARLPETFIFQNDGRFVKKVSGVTEWDSADAREYFNQLVNKRK